MTPLFMTLAGAGLLWCVPFLLERFGPRIEQRRVARLGFIAVVAATVTVEATLALIATPQVMRSLNLNQFAHVCDRLLLHLGVRVPSGLGWFALAALGPMLIAHFRIFWTGWRVERALKRLLEISTPDRSISSHVTVVDSAAVSALGVGRTHGRILVTSALVALLDDVELSVVMDHEEAHLMRGDSTRVRVLDVVSRSIRIPLITRAVWRVQLAIERAADEYAVGQDASRRTAAVSAMLKATGVSHVGGVVAFSRVDTLFYRIKAMRDGPQPCDRRFGVAALAVMGFALVMAASGLVLWTSHAHTALASAGWCPL